MTDGITVDFGSVLPYIEEKLRALFGKDVRSIGTQRALERHLRISARDATTVQIVGMDHPVSIFDIYQPTRLVRQRDRKVSTFRSLIASRSDAVIFGGPGRGKTMLMRYVFAKLASENEMLPLLFTLRWPGAAADMVTVVSSFAEGTLKRGKTRIILLVDGFDEINESSRQEVAGALRDFASQDIGQFYLTCRSFYSTDDVNAAHWDIAPFTTGDSREFIKAFGKAYRSDLAADPLIRDLRKRGLGEFLEYPLMLALVCILKSGPLPELPRTTIGLIRRAVDTLTFRWDEAKRISRQSRYDLDGEDRVRCLLRIAFAMRQLVEREHVVAFATQEHLRLMQRSDVSIDRLLEELAQWYGLLIPLEDGQWSFVHRTIHDFLAARFWVETVGFDAESVPEWNSRAAYAACLTGDATRAMVKALQRSPDISAFIECLANRAPFDVQRVAEAVVEHFQHKESSGSIEWSDVVLIKTPKDFFGFASDDFLYAILQLAAPGTTLAHDVLLWCCILELSTRGATIPISVGSDVADRFGSNARVMASMGNRKFEGVVGAIIAGGRPSSA